MPELLTAAQMREIEAKAIESGAASGLDLMERAGQATVAAMFATWPALAQTRHSAVILCGPGNNGGDGYVIARLLRDWRWEVSLFHLGSTEALPPDAARNCALWQARGAMAPIEPDAEAVIEALHGTDVLVDALFGTGLTRAIELPLAKIGTAARRAGLHRVAVDLPSGICSDSGRIIGTPDQVLAADLSVSFHRLKLGHVLSDGAFAAGIAVVGDIGLDAFSSTGETVLKVEGPQCDLTKHAGAHKYDHGHALVLSGPAGRCGAARLAARGALRIGAGLVTIGCPPDALAENAAQVTAIMLEPVCDAVALRAILKDPRKNAICIGPGLGVNEQGAALVREVLERRVPSVLDADALTLIAQDRDLFGLLHDSCVLSPHDGEFARLFPDLAPEAGNPAQTGPAYSKLDAARAAARRAGCVLVHKGPDTVIAESGGRAAIHAAQGASAAPWLATAGTGDVLAGMVVGLLARGAAPFEAAQTAVWMHGAAATRFGPGLIAEDLPEQVPAILKDIGC